MRLIATRQILATVFCVTLAWAAWGQGNVRYHGFDLDSKYRVIVEEENGTARLCLIERARAAGGPELVTMEEDEDEPSVRFTTKEVMATLRSEVSVPAAPNYFKNRGAQYRITIEGGSVGEGYARRFEVKANEARNAVLAEIQTLAAQTNGVRRDALYYTALIAMRILNESRHFPAELTLTLLNSKVGRVRLTEEGTIERRSLELGPDPDAENADPEDFQRGYERQSHEMPTQYHVTPQAWRVQSDDLTKVESLDTYTSFGMGAE